MRPSKHLAVWQSVVLVLAFLSACFSTAEDLAESIPEAAYRASVSIIIDDLGYKMEQAVSLADIPFDITFAVIPFTPYGADIAQYANKRDREVMLHAPMETLNASRWEAALNVEMDELELVTKMKDMLDDIPHVKGVNNHGGSKLTQDRERMGWVMSYLAEKKLYFVDSRTIATSEAKRAAVDAHVAHAVRDVFLDNEKAPDYIRTQLAKLRVVALENGEAIGIGHPYPSTIEMLVEELPNFSRQGIRIVFASKLTRAQSEVPRLASKARKASNPI